MQALISTLTELAGWCAGVGFVLIASAFINPKSL